MKTKGGTNRGRKKKYKTVVLGFRVPLKDAKQINSLIKQTIESYAKDHPRS